MTLQIHATTVALDGHGVLLRGPSGSGKSDLALRLIDGGARLVADDRTELWREEGRLLARAPAAIAGKIEVRGLGILALPALPAAPVALVADLVPAGHIERMPAPRRCRYLEIDLPLVVIAPFEASAAAKLRLALRELAVRGGSAIMAPP